MWLQRAASKDTQFIRRCLDGAGASAVERWFLDEYEIFVADVTTGEKRRERVGVLIETNAHELHWAVVPQHQGMGHASRMVGLFARPGHVARIWSDDVASAKVAERAGFDLIEDGSVQLWRADRALPYS